MDLTFNNLGSSGFIDEPIVCRNREHARGATDANAGSNPGPERRLLEPLGRNADAPDSIWRMQHGERTAGIEQEVYRPPACCEPREEQRYVHPGHRPDRAGIKVTTDHYSAAYGFVWKKRNQTSVGSIPRALSIASRSRMS